MAQVLFDHFAATDPKRFHHVLHVIRPYSLDTVIRHFQRHLEVSCPDLRIFDDSKRVSDLCFQFVTCIVKRFPSPGDAFGIQLTCRITKADTQGTLDSKHVNPQSQPLQLLPNVSRLTIFELTKTSTTFLLTHHTASELAELLPDAGIWNGSRKARDCDGNDRYTSTFPYLITGNRVVYEKRLSILLRRLNRVEAFSDVRFVFRKCGLVSFFFNVAKLKPDDQDLMTVMKYQCRTGTPLPLTREGLAKNPERSPFEVLSFEAPKKNMARLCTMRPQTYRVEKSADKMFFGQQFNEGTGFFALRPK